MTIKGVVQDGRINISTPPEWPNGLEVLIEPLPTKIGLDESEWRDDATSLADWEAWLRTIQPLDLSPEEEARVAQFNQAMRRYNIEAVRRQMEEGPMP